MGLFGNLFHKKDDDEPTLTSTIISENEPPTRRGRGGGSENQKSLEQELEERQSAYNEYRNEILSQGGKLGAGEGSEQLDELNRLDSLVKETQNKIDDRENRNLSKGGDDTTPGIPSESSVTGAVGSIGIGVSAGVGAIEGASALGLGIGGTGGAGLVSGAGAIGPALEPLSEQPPFEEGGTLGGNQAGGHFTDQQKRESNQRAIDEGRDPPFPEVIAGYQSPQDIADEKLQNQLAELQEQLANTDPKETYGPSQFGPYDTILNQIKDIKNQLGISGTEPDTEGGGRSGDGDLPRSEDQSTTEDLEQTSTHHESMEDATIQDNSLHFEHLGGSRSNFDNNFIGFIMSQVVKKGLNSLASSATGLDEQWTNLVIEPVVDKAPEFYSHLRSGFQNDYNRLDIHDSHSLFTSATIPIIIITLYLYLVDRSSNFKISINFIETIVIKYILKQYFKFNALQVDYGIEILKTIPKELNSAYLKQIKAKEGIISIYEVEQITKFVENINKEYFKTFNKPLKQELFNYENKQSLYLYEMLETLGSSSTLFQISSAFKTLNLLISEMIDDPYLIVQLIALIYTNSEDRSLASSDILSRGKVDRLLYYYGDKIDGVVEDSKLTILKNMHLDLDKRGNLKGMSVIENNDKVALYKYKERYYVSFRGTNVKDEKDIRDNFLNFGGKDYLNDDAYNERTRIGKRYLEEAIIKSRQEGLEPPIVLGYSLGGISAMYLATLFPNIETDVYAPILSKSELTESIMEHLGDSNIHFNFASKDPISKNLEYYRNKYSNLDINKYDDNKFYSPHSLEQFS